MDLITTPATVGYSPPSTSVVHNAAVSLTERAPASIVHLVQYDTTIPIVAVELTANGQPYTVPGGAAVNVRMKKPDGHFIYDPALGLSDDSQTAYIGVTLQMTAAFGKATPIVEIVVDGNVAATGTFMLDIDENQVPENAVESTDEYLTIYQILQQVQQAADLVEQNAQNLQNLTDNLEAVQNAAANAQAAAASAAAAQQAAQEALGFRTFFSAIIPDENGDLDPSRPMTTPSAQASWTIESKGDRIQSVQVNGFTQQVGTGDPSTTNVREITVAAQDGTLPITLTGSQTVTENLDLTAPLCDGDKVESCVSSGCDKSVIFDGSSDENWAFVNSDGVFKYTIADMPGGANAVKVLSNLYIPANWPYAATSAWPDKSIQAGVTAGSLYVKDTSFGNDVSAFKAALAAKPLYVWYQSTAYTEQNDIPVQLETHAGTLVTVDGADTLFTQGTDGYTVSLPNAANGAVICNRFANLTAANNAVTIPASQFPSSVTSLEQANTWAQSNPVTILYPLATPAVYARDPVTLVAVPYTVSDVDAANQLANTPSTLPAIDSPDVPMLLDAAEAEQTALAAWAANAVPVAGTYVVSSQDGTTAAVSLKAMQDGGDAATVGGLTPDQVVTSGPKATSSTAGVVTVSDTPDGSKTAAGGWAASPAAVQAVSADIYMVRTYAQYNASNPRLLSVVISLPDGVTAGINQFGVAVEVEDEASAAYQHFVTIGTNSATVYFRNQDGSNFSDGNVCWFNALIIVNR